MAGQTVFIVDDDPALLTSMKALVEAMHFRVETFLSAELFLNSLSPDRPGCLILDQNLPGITGSDLQQRLASLGHAVPIIFVTGEATVDGAVNVMRRGAICVLEKPYDPAELKEAIWEALILDEETREQQAEQARVESLLAGLDDGENAVLELILDGDQNKVIARKLDVGIRTVERRRHSIFEKLQVKSVAEVATLVAKVRQTRTH